MDCLGQLWKVSANVACEVQFKWAMLAYTTPPKVIAGQCRQYEQVRVDAVLKPLQLCCLILGKPQGPIPHMQFTVFGLRYMLCSSSVSWQGLSDLGV